MAETLDHFQTMQRNYASESVGQLISIALQQVVDEAKSNAPVFTGALRESIQQQMMSPLSGIAFVGVDYGAAQEFGYTSTHGNKVPGKKYFRPAAVHGRQTLLKMLRDFVKLNATRAGAKQAQAMTRGGTGRKATKYQYKQKIASGKYRYKYGPNTKSSFKNVMHPTERRNPSRRGARRYIGARGRMG